MKRDDPISPLPLGTKERKALQRLGVVTVGQLLNLDPADVCQLPGFGRGTARRIRAEQDLARRAVNTRTKGESICADWQDPVHDLELPTKVRRVFDLFDVQSLEDMRRFDAHQVIDMPGFGQTTVERIIELQRIAYHRGPGYLPRHPRGRQRKDEQVDMPELNWDSLRTVLDSLLRACVTNPRNREIYRRRIQADDPADHPPPRLQELADEYAVTRERIRQICAEVRSRLVSDTAVNYLKPFWDSLRARLEANNGFQFLAPLCKDIRADMGWREACPKLLLELVDIHPNLEADHDRRIVMLKNCHCPDCRDVRQSFGDIIEDLSDDGLSLQEAGETLGKRCRSQCLRATVPPAAFDANFVTFLADESEDCAVVGDHLVPRELWIRERSKSVRQLAQLVLKDEGSPLHFRDVRRLIAERFPRVELLNDNQVHGTLVRCHEFSCYQRGTYGLAEWDLPKYKSHGRAVIELLEHEGRPMTAQEIVTMLTRAPDFNAISIRAALHNHPRIVRVRRATYSLAERLEGAAAQ